MSDGPHPIFVGGCQRSGTHVVGHLIGATPRYHMISRELVFHCSREGLRGFLEGRLELPALLADLRGRWWRRTPPWDASVTRGLHKLVNEREFVRAVERFEATAESDPWAAARDLLDSIADPLASAADKPFWVEMSPPNIAAAPLLARLFPAARFIHVLRDGRDVASSFAHLPWGPTSLEAGLERWERAVTAASAASKAVGEGRALTVRLEDLVLLDREATLERILRFVRCNPSDEVLAFFEREVSIERAHLGRFRREVPAVDLPALNALYEQSLERLRDRGVAPLPQSAPAEVAQAPTANEPRNPLDPWSDGRAADA